MKYRGYLFYALALIAFSFTNISLAKLGSLNELVSAYLESDGSYSVRCSNTEGVNQWTKVYFSDLVLGNVCPFQNIEAEFSSIVKTSTGQFDIICKDGSIENSVNLADVSQSCQKNSVQKQIPSGSGLSQIIYADLNQDLSFSVLCEDGTMEQSSYANLVSGNVCPIGTVEANIRFIRKNVNSDDYKVTCTSGKEHFEVKPDKFKTVCGKKKVLQLAVGSDHTCVLTEEGVRCWGDNLFGQRHVPNDLKNPTQVSVGGAHACALTEEGVRCWGQTNSFESTNMPDDLKNPTQVASGGGYTCALTEEGVRCWGPIVYGRKGVPDDLKNPTQVAVGESHTCALTEEGVRCWGRNNYGQTDVPNDLKNPTQVVAGGTHTCALTEEGVRCWGLNHTGQTDVPDDLKNPTQVVAGKGYTCALTEEEVRCWGWNNYGQTDVPNDLKNPTQVAAGEFHTCALTEEGVRCWGRNWSGQTDVPEDL